MDGKGNLCWLKIDWRENERLQPQQHARCGQHDNAGGRAADVVASAADLALLAHLRRHVGRQIRQLLASDAGDVLCNHQLDHFEEVCSAAVDSSLAVEPTTKSPRP